MRAEEKLEKLCPSIESASSPSLAIALRECTADGYDNSELTRERSSISSALSHLSPLSRVVYSTAVKRGLVYTVR